MYLLRFSVVYRGISGVKCIISVYTRAFRQVSIPRETQVTSRIFHGYTTRERCINIIYHAIKNTVTDTRNTTDTWRTTERSDVIPSNIKAVLYSHWLYFPWHGINGFSLVYSCSSIRLFFGLNGFVAIFAFPFGISGCFKYLHSVRF